MAKKLKINGESITKIELINDINSDIDYLHFTADKIMEITGMSYAEYAQIKRRNTGMPTSAVRLYEYANKLKETKENHLSSLTNDFLLGKLNKFGDKK
jgi:hypothetical protein